MPTAGTHAETARRHVAGTVEQERADNQAGWVFVQRCLRCDGRLDTRDGWYELGQRVDERGGRMTTAAAADAQNCAPAE